MKHIKKIRAEKDNYVLAEIWECGENGELIKIIDSKTFMYTDCSFVSFVFRGEKAQRESRFKLAHIWADDYIKQLEKYETI